MKLKYLYFGALLVLVGTGCKKEFLDVNTNPNALPTATPAYVISNALNTSANNMLSPNETGMYWSGHWTQSNGYILSTTLFKYEFTNGDFNYWDNTYDNLYDYQYVLNNADEYKQAYLKGPAKVMMAYNFQKLVDLYGNIPYSDALKGVESLAPKFDDQKTVYEGLITLLDGAITDLKANAFASAYASSDIMFRGNTTNWIKFANSLKLRILMHQSKVSGRGAYITTEINKIVSEGTGFLTGIDAGINPGYVAAAGQINPIYNTWGYNENGARIATNNFPRITDFVVKQLQSTADTFRLKRFAYAPGNENGANPGVSNNPEIAANYIGVIFGASSGFLPGATCAIGPCLLIKGKFNNPFIMMTASEVQFCLAEAKERFGSAVNLAGTAKSYFDEGVKQNFRILGADVSKAAQLTSNGKQDCDYEASTNKLNAIAYQKWLALAYHTGLEAWTEYRKNDYPATPQSRNVIGTNRPVRLYYPGTELGSNSANINAQGTIDIFTSKIFWDIQ